MSLAQPAGGLEPRFVATWRQCFPAASAADASATWSALHRRYTEAHRHYHGLHHVAFCLGQYDLAVEGLREPGLVELAIWFHDVVYEPGKAGNEAASAALFRTLAAGGPAASVERVAALILDTMHVDQPDDADAGYLVDVDLASLGQPWPHFLRDSRALRMEQQTVPDAEYLPAQARFLGRLLERRFIYCTPFFRSRYETRARHNIKRCLAHAGDLG